MPKRPLLLKVCTFLVCLIPLGVMITRIITNNFGPDPAQELAKESGEWALRFLVLALAMTPARTLTGQVWIVRQRRMVGLYALFYASCHFLVWITFLLQFRWVAIVEELIERPFITVGFASFLILLAVFNRKSCGPNQTP